MRKLFFIPLLLAAMTWLVFYQVTSFKLINFDDPKYVGNNERVHQGITTDNVVWSFTTTFFLNYHPLTWLSYMLDANLYGTNWGGFHLTNLLLHTANVLLLYFLLRRMTGDEWPSAAVAALFAIHPLHVESVAWIAERKDVLSTFFGLLAICAYARYAQKSPSLAKGRLNRPWVWYVLTILAFVAALLSKPMLVTFPFLLLLLDYWPLQRTGEPVGKLILEKVPFLVLSAAMCVVVFVAQREAGAMPSFEQCSLTTRILNAVLAYGLYLKKTIWPIDLGVYYPHPRDAISLVAVGIAAAVIVRVTMLAVAQRRTRPYLLVGWLWYLGTLVPVIGVVQVGNQQMADRYSYVPLIGIFIAVVWTIHSSVRPAVRWLLPLVALPMLAALMFIAYRQVGYWRDSIDLMRRTIDVTGPNALMHFQIGNVHLERSRWNEALASYRKSLDIYPTPSAHTAIGRVLQEHGWLDDATKHFESALRLDQNFANALLNMGVIRIAQNRPAEAEAYFRKAIAADPKLVDAHLNLGLVLSLSKRWEDVANEYETALKLDPKNVKGHSFLGTALAKLGRARESQMHLKRAAELREQTSSKGGSARP